MVNSTLMSKNNISISDGHIGLDVASGDYYDNIDTSENTTSNITTDFCEVSLTA